MRRHGFTLIEVLVVIGIIALLVVILLAGISGAKEKTRLTTCGTNLRQMATALSNYAVEQKGQYPLYQHFGSYDFGNHRRSLGRSMWNVILPLLEIKNYLKSDAVGYCVFSLAPRDGYDPWSEGVDFGFRKAALDTQGKEWKHPYRGEEQWNFGDYWYLGPGTHGYQWSITGEFANIGQATGMFAGVQYNRGVLRCTAAFDTAHDPASSHIVDSAHAKKGRLPLMGCPTVDQYPLPPFHISAPHYRGASSKRNVMYTDGSVSPDPGPY